MDNVYLEYRLSDGVVEKIHSTIPIQKSDYGIAITCGFKLGDEEDNFIIINEVDEELNLISSAWVRQTPSGKFLRQENTLLKNRIAELEDILAGVIGGAL